MKRTQLKRGTSVLKRTPMKAGTKRINKVAKTGLAKEKAKAWALFSKFIRLRDAIRTTGTMTDCACITCGRVYPISGKGCIQAGHFVAGRNNGILFELRGVHGQCYICNTVKKGNSLVYRRKIVELYGEGVDEELEALAAGTVKFTPYQMIEFQETVKTMIKTLEEAGR